MYSSFRFKQGVGTWLGRAKMMLKSNIISHSFILGRMKSCLNRTCLKSKKILYIGNSSTDPLTNSKTTIPEFHQFSIYQSDRIRSKLVFILVLSSLFLSRKWSTIPNLIQQIWLSRRYVSYWKLSNLLVRSLGVGRWSIVGSVEQGCRLLSNNFLYNYLLFSIRLQF